MKTFTKALIVAAVAGAAAAPLAIAMEAHQDQQPHMTAALTHLQEAKKELEAAAPDKGGHRAEAIKAVDSAIHHTQAGIKAGAK